MTSLFWFGEETEGKPDDYRAELHDTDGLLIWMENDETVWRPLENPLRHHLIRHSVFAADGPQALGLLQRDREYLNYHEIMSLYHRTPSMMVRPEAKELEEVGVGSPEIWALRATLPARGSARPRSGQKTARHV